VLTSKTIDQMIGAKIQFKCENFQKVGAFKVRGAMNAVLQLNDSRRRPITTHSSGNHGQAIAYAARVKGLKAVIVMPKSAPEVKREAVLGYGAEVVECEPTLVAREEQVQSIVNDSDAVVIHPFDNDKVIAGQATVAKELIDQNEELKKPSLDYIIAPVGGGGLLS